jgi:DNA-binding HxlR family transcriptional regulator
VKILINLQTGSVRVSELRNTLRICSKAVLAQGLPGNHRGGRSAFVGGGFS